MNSEEIERLVETAFALTDQEFDDFWRSYMTAQVAMSPPDRSSVSAGIRLLLDKHREVVGRKLRAALPARLASLERRCGELEEALDPFAQYADRLLSPLFGQPTDVECGVEGDFQLTKAAFVHALAALRGVNVQGSAEAWRALAEKHGWKPRDSEQPKAALAADAKE